MRMMHSGQYLGENQQSRKVAGIVVSKTIYRRGVYEGWHAHSSTHITYVLRGGNREVRKTSEHEARPGKVLFYRQNEPHRNNNTQLPTLNINVELTPACLRNNFISEADLHTGLQQHPNARLVLLKMYKETLLNDEHVDASLQMFLHTLTTFSDRRFSPETWPDWMKKVHQCIHDQWHSRIRLDQLAQASGVSPVTISKHFPRYLGCTLGEYMRRLKIDHALAWMKTSDRNLADIAYACGFADQSHFTRTFRQQTSMLPTQFRAL
ncbi:AraC family transcriptional regulator [Oleiagrimonas sp. MCCC 1A03011]|uniref:AraC family transcriptional regulator n=1 Tax=Oleiagrimonas sp. MCCC 1A03011 TaxID=1926883 RepID=UPI000DC434A6|nr:AraC family transcriptional regulator [Oleiagrimonas sp. MCCC 1A03011]RAP58174.1 hypothetical protein BTJ49_04110 [Oleiagrimonas sp. MCCC 1A03011]